MMAQEVSAAVVTTAAITTLTLPAGAAEHTGSAVESAAQGFRQQVQQAFRRQHDYDT